MSTHDENTGMLLGLLGVLIFSATLPMSRIAVAELSPWFVAMGRALVAGVAALATVLAFRIARPHRGDLVPLLVTALGIVYGFPVFSSLAMQYVPASHGAIVNALLPLATAVVGVMRQGHRPSPGFWMCAIAGSALVLVYAFARGAGKPHLADGLMLLAVITGAIGYTEGAKLATRIGGIATICWALVLTLPANLALTVWLWPANAANVSASVWTAFAYLGVFSMFLGFFPWYKGLALGGVARVSQVQLLQAFFTLFAAAILIGERITWLEWLFAALVATAVFIGRKMPIRRQPSLARG